MQSSSLLLWSLGISQDGPTETAEQQQQYEQHFAAETVAKEGEEGK